jgi:CubicO group peptidase (beta-lactamase class C family)
MTFSVTKSFLSSTVGLALDRGLIRDLNDPVRIYAPGGHFESEHNRKITWDHLLRQTSGWEGTLWDKPDWAGPPPSDQTIEHYKRRKRHEPGSVYRYNDVRVNLLALARTRHRAIGASNTWRWHGYSNSWILMDGVMVQSVSGGGHWGGGMMISARNLARFGLLTLRRGKWKDKQILSENWVRMALTPTKPEPGYGFMNWFLNTGRKMLPSPPESPFMHRGAGNNLVYVDPVNDLVVVCRWIQSPAMDGVVQRLIASIQVKYCCPELR